MIFWSKTCLWYMRYAAAVLLQRKDYPLLLNSAIYFPARHTFRPHVVSGHSPKAATQFRVAILSATTIIFATAYR